MGALAGAAGQDRVDDEERIARAELTWLAEPGDRLLGALVRSHGAAPAMEAVRSGRLPDPPPSEADSMLPAMARWQDRLGEVPSPDAVRRMLDGPVRLVCPGDEEWPVGLVDLGDAAPTALWVDGQPALLACCLRSAAVTGARAATAYGSFLAADFGASLAARGITVIAGGSFGIDAAAHRGALSAGGATVAVLACGVDVPYPASHADLFEGIRAHGALVSEHPPGRHVNRLRFLDRSRVIAALAAGTVIVEATERSGALAAARHACELGRPTMAVPGPVTSGTSAGCNRLIRDGHATLVTSAGDVADALPPA